MHRSKQVITRVGGKKVLGENVTEKSGLGFHSDINCEKPNLKQSENQGCVKS